MPSSSDFDASPPPEPDAPKVAGGEGATPEGWRMLWDDAYAVGEPADGRLNVSGWTSSYTGEPIPAAEMREWVERTVERILSCLPEEGRKERRALEIGCGTGMLLFRVAPEVAAYHGIDFAPHALAHIRGELGDDADGVTLEESRADAFEGPGHPVDLVILNSVAQYFPDADYLRTVLRRGWDALAPGGAFWVGDVRSLPLLPAFALAIELARADGSLPLDVLARRLETRLAGEGELLVAPSFFRELEDHLPGLADVEIQLKRGRRRNEMNAFRYDVVLRKGADVEVPGTSTEPGVEVPGVEVPGTSTEPVVGEPLVRDWAEEDLTVSALRRELLAAQKAGSLPAALELRNVPNARVAAEVLALELLREPPEGMETAGDLQAAVRRARPAGVDPEELWSLERRFPYRVEVGWEGADGRMRVRLLPARGRVD